MSFCRSLPGALVSLVVLSTSMTACLTPEEYLAQADEQSYALIDARRAALFEEGGGFTIEPPADSLRQRILRGEWDGSRELDLLECLDIAAENSREYQSRKESLYLSALDLTLARWRLSNQPFATLGAGADGTPGSASDRNVDADAGLTRVLGSGASIVTSIGSSLFRVVTTGDGWDVVSNFNLSITQPLMRGAGRKITLEPLTQAERNLVYQARDFERFRRTYAVQVATQVYRLLLALDVLDNQIRNYENLAELRERNDAYADAGRMSRIEADQARQDELRSELDLVAQRAALARQFDNFKLFLGLPIDADLSLDRSEYDRIVTEDDVLENIDLMRAVEIALLERLDFRTTVDQFEDSRRRVGISRDAVRAGLGLDASVGSSTVDSGGTNFDATGTTWSAGLNFDLPVNRIPERNAYRSSLITLQVARRNVEQDSDQIEANVRDAVRVSVNARRSYEIQLGATQLAERRVESSRLNLEGGEASTRDVLESEEALRNARNSKTTALINYTLARLDLYLELEALRVSETGIGFEPDLLERVRSAQ
tara:strand:+ start:18129 stop:19760 length:1632 start_codon:yes stop_codon:yes gene_type:complete